MKMFGQRNHVRVFPEYVGLDTSNFLYARDLKQPVH